MPLADYSKKENKFAAVLGLVVFAVVLLIIFSGGYFAWQKLDFKTDGFKDDGVFFELRPNDNLNTTVQEISTKEVEAYNLLICYQGTQWCNNNLSKDEARKKIEALKLQVTPDNFIELSKANSTEPGAYITGGYLGWFKLGDVIPVVEKPAFSLAVGQISDVLETEYGFHLLYKTNERDLMKEAE